MNDTACKCGHEPGDHFDRWGYCNRCLCWIFREQFDWADAMRNQ